MKLPLQAINDPFMDPAKLPSLDDLQGAPVKLSYHEVIKRPNWMNLRNHDSFGRSDWPLDALASDLPS